MSHTKKTSLSRFKNHINEITATQEHKRGVYRGPQPEFIDHTTAQKIPDGFYLDMDTQLVISEIVQAGLHLSCETILHPRFWDDSWKRCPICGTEPDLIEGTWVHQGEQ